MPIYEYRCKSCNHGFEKLQKATEQPLTICPACQQAELTKLVSNSSFQLKGNGWYVTDFKNAKPAPQAAKASTPTSSPTVAGSALKNSASAPSQPPKKAEK